jgi:hypothetical protein
MDDPRSQERRDTHADFVASFGFSDEDRRRIKLLAHEVTPHYSPAALGDLSVPIRVGARLAKDVGRSSGRVLGTLTRPDGVKVALLYWRVTRGMEMEAWERARGRR